MARATTPTRNKKPAAKARSTSRPTAPRRAAPVRTAAAKKTKTAGTRAAAKSPAKTTRTAKPSKATTARKAPVKAATSPAKALRADLEKLEAANKTLRAKQREAVKAAKFAEGRIAELETQVAELEMQLANTAKPKRGAAPKRTSRQTKADESPSPDMEQPTTLDDEVPDQTEDLNLDEF